MKTNLTTIFIQLLRTKTIDNNNKNIAKKNMKKEEEKILPYVVASEAKKRKDKRIRKVY